MRRTDSTHRLHIAKGEKWMVQSRDAERSDTEAFVLPHAQLCSYSFFLALAPSRSVFSGDISVMWRYANTRGLLSELGDHGPRFCIITPCLWYMYLAWTLSLIEWPRISYPSASCVYSSFYQFTPWADCWASHFHSVFWNLYLQFTTFDKRSEPRSCRFDFQALYYLSHNMDMNRGYFPGEVLERRHSDTCIPQQPPVHMVIELPILKKKATSIKFG